MFSLLSSLGSHKEIQDLESGHYSVVFGYDKKYLWLADPSKHHTHKQKMWGARKINKKLFNKVWIDTNDNTKIYKKWILTVNLSQKARF